MTRRDVRLTRLVLVVHVPSDAAGRRARERVMASVMTGDAADQRSANAAFGVHRGGGHKGCGDSQRQGCTK